MPPEALELTRLRLDKARLAEVPQRERALFFSLGHLSNELNALRKLVIWAGDLPEDPPEEPSPLVSGQVALTMFLLKLLIGKLKEGHELLQKSFFGTGVSKEYDGQMNSFAQEALRDLKSYFSRTDGLTRVRDAFSFHYSAEEIDAALLHLGVGDELDFYLTDNHANCLYYGPELLANTAVLRSRGLDDKGAALEAIMMETTSVTDWFLTFVDGFILLFFAKHPTVRDLGGAATLHLDELRPFDSIALPWFTQLKTTYK